jgi:hypothetical protein
MRCPVCKGTLVWRSHRKWYERFLKYIRIESANPPPQTFLVCQQPQQFRRITSLYVLQCEQLREVLSDDIFRLVALDGFGTFCSR